MNDLTKRLAIMILIILVIGALGYLTREVRSLQWLIENETRMRSFVQGHPWQSWSLGLTMYTAFSLVPGTTGKSVVWGWLFGFWPAVVIVDVGLTLAAVASFLVSRFLLRDVVIVRFSDLVAKLDRSLNDDGAFYLLMMRIAHAPYTFVNYAAGATSVPMKTFVWTTALGLLPGTMIFVFVGTRIPTLKELTTGGAWQLLDPLLISILAATVVFPFLIRHAVRSYRNHVSAKLQLNEMDIMEGHS